MTRFALGRIVGTPGALDALKRAEQEPDVFLAQHARGDWGVLCEEDKQLNDEALKDGGRIHSAYDTLAGERIWIITEADRSTTTILLPEDY